MKCEALSPFILSASLCGRAGILTPSESNLNFLHSQTSTRASTRWVRAAQRHEADGSRELETCAPITSTSRALQDSPLQSCCDWFHGKGSQLQPKGTEAPLILVLNFLPSLLTFCQSCFQGKLSPSLLCCQTGLMWNKKKIKPKPIARVWFFCLGF